MPISAVLIDQGDIVWTTAVTIDCTDYPKAQSFTPAQDNIAEFEIYIKRLYTTDIDINVYITNTYDNNIPTGDEIEFVSTLSYTSISTTFSWVLIDITTPIAVTIGNLYWIVLAAVIDDPNNYYELTLAPDIYSGGQFYQGSSYDIWFRTYYDETFPEFSSIPLFFLSGCILIFSVFVRKTRKK